MIFCVTGRNDFGCADTACVKVEVRKVCDTFFIPDAFAPETGGAEANDCFRAYGNDCFKEMTLTVFDRWGHAIFETSNWEDCWDGTHNDKKLNTGVYVYLFKATLLNGDNFLVKGNVTLIR
jgi:gliding motility-associated-like protein